MEGGTVVFSISKRNLNCIDVIKTLVQCNINASVTENITTICNTDKCWLENGCQIVTSNMNKDKIKNLWNKLKYNHDLNCCHLKTQNDYQGCVKDFICESNCK